MSLPARVEGQRGLHLGAYNGSHEAPSEDGMSQLHVEVLHTVDCAHWRAMHDCIEVLARREGIAVATTETNLDEHNDASSAASRWNVWPAASS